MIIPDKDFVNRLLISQANRSGTSLKMERKRPRPNFGSASSQSSPGTASPRLQALRSSSSPKSSLKRGKESRDQERQKKQSPRSKSKSPPKSDSASTKKRNNQGDEDLERPAKRQKGFSQTQ